MCFCFWTYILPSVGKKKEKKEKKKEWDGARRKGKRNLAHGLGFQTSRIIIIHLIQINAKMPTCSNPKCVDVRCRLAVDLRLQKNNEDISALSERFNKCLVIERKKKEKKNIERKKKYERKKEKRYDGN